jgi:ABC-type bacteriocin/lantibiotic exporter with double-glycine peptidase domain
MAEKSKLVNKPFRRFVKLLSLDRRDIIYVFMYSVFAGLIGLSIPLGVQAIINLIAMGQTSTSWIVLTFMIAGATALMGFMKLMQFNITELLQQRIFTRSAFEFAYRIPRFRIENINDQYAPELANRFFDTLSVQKGLPKIVTDLSESSLQIFFGLILLALYHPFFVAFGAVLIALLALVIYFTGARGLKSSLTESKYKYKVAYWLEELGRTMNSFKLVGYTAYPLEKTDHLVDGYLEYRRKHFAVLRWQMISIIAMKTIATASLLLIGGLLVINNEINIGQFVAAEIMIIMVLNSLEKIITSMETIFDVLTSVEKIGAVTDLPLESEEGMDFKEFADKQKGLEVKVESLSYTPMNSSLPTLHDINLSAKAGEKVAIVGWAGAGKSTLIKVLIGLYENYTGTLCYNQIPRKNINVASLRSFMGDYVTEEALFNSTLEKNISMGRPNVTTQDIISTCEQIGLLDYVQKLPHGLDTIIPSDGAGIPQTIIKRIILARCIVDVPKLVATESILNGMTDIDRSNIMRVLLRGPWTLFSTTNKAEFCRRCDKIIVLKEGRAIFTGSFTQLEQQPYCRELFEDY